MSRQFRILIGTLPCVFACVSGGFAQTPGAVPHHHHKTVMAQGGAPGMAPNGMAPGGMGVTNTWSNTTTTTHRNHRPRAARMQNMGAAMDPIPNTGGDPAEFVLLGSALSLSMLGLRRRLRR